MRAGVDTLVSGGVVQSNSQRQVAAAAAKLGLDCHLAVYHGRLAPPSPEYEPHRQRAAQPPVRRAPCTTCRGTATATAPSATSRAGCRRRAASLTSCPTASPIRWARSGYASTIAEIAQQCAGARRQAARHRALLGQRRHAGRAGRRRARLPARARASSASISTPSPSGCAPTCWPTAAPRPSCSTSRSTRPMSRSSPAMPVRPMACRMQATVEAIRLGGAARSAGARSGLFRQGPGRPDRADPRADAGRADEDVVFIHTGGAPALFAYRHLFDPE